MLYRQEKALWQLDHSWDGFKWIDANNAAQAIIIFQRHGLDASDDLTILINCTPETHEHFRIGVVHNSAYQEIFNSDNVDFGGSGLINTKIMISEEIPCHGQPYSITLSIPPLGGVILKQVK
jgi:1,4-alpha-glucan branching enzyme